MLAVVSAVVVVVVGGGIMVVVGGIVVGGGGVVVSADIPQPSLCNICSGGYRVQNQPIIEDDITNNNTRITLRINDRMLTQNLSTS